MSDDEPPTRATRSRSKLRYRRILLKLSGEALQGAQGHGIDPAVLAALAQDLQGLRRLGVEIGLVIGGGNIFRGLAGSASGMDRSKADNIGMLATVMNCLALQDALERAGVPATVLSALEMNKVAEPYTYRRASALLEAGEVVLFAGGTGNPYFTTDTAAALRALEIGADALFKATKVDGVYSADPVKDPDATFYPELSYQAVLEQGLKVMDAAAVSLCMDSALPLVVFNMQKKGNIRRAVTGQKVGTRVVAGPAAPSRSKRGAKR